MLAIEQKQLGEVVYGKNHSVSAGAVISDIKGYLSANQKEKKKILVASVSHVGTA